MKERSKSYRQSRGDFQTELPVERFHFIKPLNRLVVFFFVLAALRVSPAVASDAGPKGRVICARTFSRGGPTWSCAADEPCRPLTRLVVEQLFPASEDLPASGKNLAESGRCEEAAQALLGARDIRPLASNADKSLGMCYFRTHRFEVAISYLQRAVRLQPDDEEAWIFLSRSYFSNGRPKDAVQTLKGWLSKNSNDVDALYWIGKYYDELAEQTFKAMASKNPDNYLVLKLEGDQFRLNQQYEKALEAYRRALEMQPNAPGFHFNIGDAFWRMMKFSEAKVELEKELEINPFHAEANFELGDLTIKRGDVKEGIPYVEKAVMLNPRLMEAHRTLGRAFLTEKRYDEALREFLQVARDDPSDNTIHALLATTYQRMGRLKEAEEESRTSQKLIETKNANLERLKALERSGGEPSPSPPKK